MDPRDVLSTINKIWPNINGQVTGYFSNTIFDKLRQDETRVTQISLVAIAISVIYIIMEPWIRKGVKLFQGTKENKLWGAIIEELMNVTYRFFLFIIIQYINLLVGREGSGFSSVTFFQQLVEIVVITFALVTIVSFLNYLDEKEKIKDSYLSESISNFTTSYNAIYGVVIQFFSAQFFRTVREEVPSPMRAAMVTLGFFSFYLVFEFMARMVIEWSDPKQRRRPLWDRILNEYLDFVFVFAIFIIVQYIGLFISDEVTDNLGIFQEMTIVFLIFVSFFSVMRAIVELTSKEDSSKTWFLTDTTKRIWPKINGTTTGLVAAIITDRLLTTPNEEMFLIYLILVVLLYSIFDVMVRKAIEAVEELKERQPIWNSVVEEILDFFFSLGLLLFLSTLTQELAFLEVDSLFETFIVVISSQMILSTLLVWFKEAGKKEEEFSP